MRVQKWLETKGNAVAVLVIEGIECDLSRDLKFLPDHAEQIPAFIASGKNSQYAREVLNIAHEQIGSLEARYLKDFFVFTYFLCRETGVNAIDELNVIASIANQVGLHLWKIKDNAVNLNNAFMLENNAGAIRIHKNSIKTYYFDRQGKSNKEQKYSWNDLRKAFTDATVAALYNAAESPAELPSLGTSRVKGTPRYHRFYFWLNDARKQDDLLIRLSLYVTSLEALLSTSQSELSHTLSERVAIFLSPESGESRIRVYKNMKKCYSMRSKGLHGDTIKKEQRSELQEMCAFLDQATRLLAKRIDIDEAFLKVLGDDQLLDEAALRLLLGDE